MTLAERSDVQALSKTLFGQRHRLAVMSVIARTHDAFTPGDLAAILGFRAQSSIQGPLRDLESAQLITRMPKQANTVHYRRNESLAWDWAVELIEFLNVNVCR